MDSIQNLLSYLRSRLTKLESGNIRETHELFFKDGPTLVYDLKISLSLPGNQEIKNVIHEEIIQLINQIRNKNISLLQKIKSFTRYKFPDGQVLEILEKGSISEFDIEIEQTEFATKDDNRRIWFNHIEKEISTYENLFTSRVTANVKKIKPGLTREKPTTFGNYKVPEIILQDIYGLKFKNESGSITHHFISSRYSTFDNFKKIMLSPNLATLPKDWNTIEFGCNTNAAIQILKSLIGIFPNLDNMEMISTYEIFRTMGTEKKPSVILKSKNASSSHSKDTKKNNSYNKFAENIRNSIEIILKKHQNIIS